jgi:hypothetical protein
MFKRSVTFLTRDDSDMTEKVSIWGRLHEFGDVTWLPYQRKVVYRQDDRVDVATPGDAINDFLGFRSQAKLSQVTARLLGTSILLCKTDESKKSKVSCNLEWKEHDIIMCLDTYIAKH